MSMKARITACIYILSTAISLILVFAFTDAFKDNREFTRKDDGRVTASGVYYAHNREDSGYIFRIGLDGKVIKVINSRVQGEERVEKIDFFDGTLHVLYSSERQFDDEMRTVYRIVTYDNKMKALKDSYRFVPDQGGVIRGFVAESGRYYMTYISADGTTINVYEVLTDELIELSSDNNVDDEQIEELESVMGRTCSEGAFYADACYSSAALFIRKPSDKPEGVFAIDPVLINTVSKMKLSFIQYLSVYKNIWIIWFASLMIWFVLLYIGIRILENRDRMVYEAVLMEGLLLVVLAGCFTFAGAEYRKVAVRDANVYADMALSAELDDLQQLKTVDYDAEDYYNSEEYKLMQASLSEFAKRKGNSRVFRDVFVMKTKDRMVVNGVSGMNREDAALQYGTMMKQLQKELRPAEPNVSVRGEIDGEEVYAVGTGSGGNDMKYILVGVVDVDYSIAGFWSDFKLRLIVFILFYIVVGALIMFVIYLRARDLKAFEYVISEAAIGNRSGLKVPETEAKDMRSMWRSLSELCKKIDEISYSRFKIFEAYYRFAPKNIETVMGKDSITDVKNGDVTSTEGTLMLVTSGDGGYGEKQIHALNNMIYFMEEYADRGEGILVSEDSALSMLQFLFLKENRGISQRATQFLHRNASDEEAGSLSVFLYYAPFMYGIAGTQTQSLTYLAFEYARELENYARWFRSMKLCLVITEEVKCRENPGEIRYIGYIRLSKGDRKVLLYEVLDACSARERQLKLVNKEKFEATLELFYQRNFYLARNQFSELLREIPDDEIVKWYLFRSENYLNDGKINDDFGQLTAGS